MKTIVSIIITLLLVGCKESTYIHRDTGDQRDMPRYARYIDCQARRIDKQMEYCLSMGHSEGACWAAVHVMADTQCL